MNVVIEREKDSALIYDNVKHVSFDDYWLIVTLSDGHEVFVKQSEVKSFRVTQHGL